MHYESDRLAKLQLLQDVKDSERRLLSGSCPRADDLEGAIRIFLEFLRGYESLNIPSPCVTVFGSARILEGSPYYRMARDLGRRLAHEGFTVMTGGGPGLMEAANRGAKEAGGHSIGCAIKLAHEEAANPYLDLHVEFEHFFVRKVMLVKYSSAFVLMPGGFGTLDEMFEALVLVQTQKIDHFPVVALGGDFWQDMRAFMAKTLLANKTISAEDCQIIKFASTVDEAVEHIVQGAGHPHQPPTS